MDKKIAVINDISGFGRCSLTAAIPVISAMGSEPCPLVTAVLSAQTGFPGYHMTDLTDHMEPVMASWEKMGEKFDGIYSGFLTGRHQVELVKKFIEKFRRPGTILLTDPIMGDNGALFPIFDMDFVGRMLEIVSVSDIVTPNLTELCLLTGADFGEITEKAEEPDYFDRIAELGYKLISHGAKSVAVTGIHRGGSIANLTMDSGGCSVSSQPMHPGSFSGTGDLFASVLCGGAMKGMSLNASAELASRFINAAIQVTPPGRDRNHGVSFEKVMHLLID
jgi:pyridoxine kinase